MSDTMVRAIDDAGKDLDFIHQYLEGRQAQTAKPGERDRRPNNRVGHDRAGSRGGLASLALAPFGHSWSCFTCPPLQDTGRSLTAIREKFKTCIDAKIELRSVGEDVLAK